MNQSTQSQTINYPVEEFPPILRNAIKALHDDTQFPLEMIATTVLAAAALVCQNYIEVISPFTNEPEPCSLYFLTVAASSEGKSTLYNKVMAPFYDFTNIMKGEYQKNLSEYRCNVKKWKIRESALASNLKKAMRDEDDEGEEIATELFNSHQDSLYNDPYLVKPKKFNLIYEDAAFKALIEGLRDQPSAAIFSSEAITFFKGRLKNHLGILNKAWGGETYPYHRADEEDIELKARLTLLLMVQPHIFAKYINNSINESGGSGFLSRFLFTNTVSTIGERQITLDFTRSDENLKKLHERMNCLLLEQKIWFHDNSKPKHKSDLSEDIKNLFETKIAEYQSNIGSQKKWEHIRSTVSKAGSNALRIATIFSVFDSDNTNVKEFALEKSFKIVEWHLEQMSSLLYPWSADYLFKRDVYDLFEWVRKRFHSNFTTYGYFAPFLKTDIENGGPHRLRKIEALTPVLNELIALGKLAIIRFQGSNADYVAVPRYDFNGFIEGIEHNANRPFKIIHGVQKRSDALEKMKAYDPIKLTL
ncbi:DUF3987 domain-containing protein [Enterobacter hormaechei]|uniref:DUF3987 domain-containing protein n=1 Tax=Enterobacter hormaechei TaxID=158836 RepID=UPI002A74DE2A|nr:DUF3987 domain-containing protein [Enterobacter hormaechei]MDY3572485.1 DUF3987 domain-containing protein [Enterobacter hormaechei]